MFTSKQNEKMNPPGTELFVSSGKPILVIYAAGQANKILPKMEQIILLQAKGDRFGETRIERAIEVKSKSFVT